MNTTAGTGSEMTRFCIITDTSRKVKMAIVDWRCTPSVAIDDPVLMMGMPPALTAATGMDALTHAVEAYVSTAATPMTDACAEKAMEYINRYLRRAVANGNDKEAREGMCYAQYLAGMAFNNASLGHVHAMAHQLGGFYNLPHGECNAILLPYVCEYNRISSRRRFGRIAELLGEITKQRRGNSRQHPRLRCQVRRAGQRRRHSDHDRQCPKGRLRPHQPPQDDRRCRRRHLQGCLLTLPGIFSPLM